MDTYTWQSGTFQIDQRTTTFPAVATGENGSGSSNTRVETFNAYGQVEVVTDERGIETSYTYDPATGGVTQTVQDVGGLGLTTDYTVDRYGRTTQALGPIHSLDIGGTNTSIRRATWTVYADNDLAPEVREGQGYQKPRTAALC
ncbi:MAG: hypothetical protein KIS67_23395 [Verrucomicrobiae bacterium]|nr:hypothetical protein [Verrucomicrobiae bacterium]